jgi:hypothetical protein
LRVVGDRKNPTASCNKKPCHAWKHDDELHSLQFNHCRFGSFVRRASAVVGPGELRRPVLRTIDGGEEFWLATDACDIRELPYARNRFKVST